MTTRKRKYKRVSVSERAKILSQLGGNQAGAGTAAGGDSSLVPASVLSSSSSKKRRTKKVRAFTKKDFHSGDGMLTTVWGPSM